MAKLEIDENGTKGVLKLDQELTIHNAEEFKTTLMESMDKVKHLTLDLEKLETVDLTFLQLVCSAKLSACRQGKSFSFKNGINESVKEMIYDAGFKEGQKFSICPDGKFPWNGGRIDE